MKIHIDSTGKRFNPSATHVVDGIVYKGNILQFPNAVSALGVSEIDDDVPPTEFSTNPELYEVREDWETSARPYTIYSRKSEDVIKLDAQRIINTVSRAYLLETDWYVSRFSETGVAIPDEVKAKRQAARDAVVGWHHDPRFRSCAAQSRSVLPLAISSFR